MVTNKKRIQAYVDLSTYESLNSLARDRKMSLSRLAGEILQNHSMVDNSHLTREDFSLILENLRLQIVSEINELKVQNEVISDLEKVKHNSSKNQRRKKKGFAK